MLGANGTRGEGAQSVRSWVQSAHIVRGTRGSHPTAASAWKGSQQAETSGISPVRKVESHAHTRRRDTVRLGNLESPRAPRRLRSRLDGSCEQALHPIMARTVLSLADARRAAQDPANHLIWVAEEHAPAFQERGWVRLEPPRGGGVMFLHRQRQEAARSDGGERRDPLKRQA